MTYITIDDLSEQERGIRTYKALEAVKVCATLCTQAELQRLEQENICKTVIFGMAPMQALLT